MMTTNGYQAFPLDCLPEAVRRYVMAHAGAIDCDQAAVKRRKSSRKSQNGGGLRAESLLQEIMGLMRLMGRMGREYIHIL